MAHQVQQMAYVGETPWHGLGNELTPQQPLEVWAEQSGMSFQILETPVRFMAESAGPLEFHQNLHRSESSVSLRHAGCPVGCFQPLSSRPAQ